MYRLNYESRVDNAACSAVRKRMLCKKPKELVLSLKPFICRARKCYSYVLVFVKVLRIF